jgi:signal transduction histidine kinase
MASQENAAFDSGPLPLEQPRSNDGLADRVQEAYERGLRAALASIAANADLAGHQANQAQAKQLEAIAQAAAVSGRMAADFVEFVCVELGGGIQVVRRPVDLRLVCDRVVDAIQQSHPCHTVELARSQRLEGEWDPDRIGSLLSKLVLNAFEHGVGGRGVRVRLESAPHHAIIEVWNSGPPIDDMLMRRMFEPFARGPFARPDSGLGLGLYLVRAIARAHGGRIEVKSNAREGTTFRVILPRS